jgi:hypothetical protein
MLTLRTNDFQAAWSRRSADLEQRRLNQYRDVLLEYLEDHCYFNLQDINSALLTRCMVGDGPHQLYAVIWTYRDMVPYNQDGSVPLTVQEKHDHCASIRLEENLNPHHDETEEEDTPRYETLLKPQRVDTILRKTSVLPLLSGRFGNNYWVSRHVNPFADVPEPNPTDAWREVEYQLHLNYFPRGLPRAYGKKIMDARADRGEVYPVPLYCETTVTHSR